MRQVIETPVAQLFPSESVDDIYENSYTYPFDVD